jgi:hypothetical protein
MKQKIIISILLLWFFAACDDEVFEKPKNLIKEKTMIDMMVDVHLAEATHFTQTYRDTTMRKLTSTDYYYSILHKYNVPDSLFERSFIYYASQPKLFEKMYRKVTNRLTEIEQEHTGRSNELLEFEDTE